MKVYKNAIIATGIITLISFLPRSYLIFTLKLIHSGVMPCWAYLVAVC